MSPEDLRQETFARAALVWDGIWPERTVPFLYRIATNILRDEWRARMRRQRPEYQAALSVHEAPSISADQFERVLLQDIVRQLTPLQREVFVLGRFGGRSYQEISEICGISVRAVERRMSEALAICAEALRSD